MTNHYPNEQDAEAKSRFVAQEGGDHYQNEYQHWDWVSDIGMGYLPGNATKYVSRWRKKNGLADLKKAMTYVEKMIAIRRLAPDAQFNNPIGNGYKIGVCTDRFTLLNKLDNLERSFCEALSYKCDDAMLKVAKALLESLILAAGRASPAAATLAPASPATLAPAPLCGPAAGAMVQAPGTSGTTGVGHPAPFGYDGNG